MSGWIIFSAEVALMVICFLASKWWVENKSTPDGEVPIGRDEYMTFGKDSTEIIERMTEFAKEIFSKEELLKSEYGFSVKVSMKNNEIDEVVVKSKKTKVTYTGKEVSVINTVNTKWEVITFLALMSWCAISLIPWVCTGIVIVIQIFTQIL